MKSKSNISLFLGLTGSLLLTVTSASAATLYWDGSTSTANADGGAGAWNGTDLWDLSAIAGTNATWTSGDYAVFGGTASALVTTGAPITTSGIQFNTTGYTITATSTNNISFTDASNITFNNIAAGTITGTVTGSGSVAISATNPFTAGTLTLGGTSTGGWSGTTTINPGMTLNLSNDNQALNGTSAITLNGGGITLTNASATAVTNNKISNSAGITSNGGTISIINTSGAGVYAETIGSVALTTGQLNIGLNNDHNAAAGSQTITLSGLTRTGATNTSSVTFSAWSTGLNSTKNRIAITGYVDGFMGAWATTGTGIGGATQTDYAFITDVGGIKYVTATNIAATAENSASWTAGGSNVTLSGATTLTGTRTLNTLRYTGSAQALALGGNNLETYGILNGGSGVLTVSGTGALTTASGGGNLFLTSGNNGITVSSAINDNGGAVTLIKNGAGMLTLSSITSNFSGGIVLNAGQITFTNNLNLGSGGGITVNGTASIDGGDQYSLARSLTLNDGGALTLSNGFGVTGVFSGNGALNVTTADDFNFTNAANTYTGAIASASSGSLTYGLTFASIGDTVGAGLISLAGNSGTFRWTSASGSTTTLANRQFALSSAGAVGASMTSISALGTTAASNLVISKDLLVTGTAGARALRLAGTNTGNNTFAGKITDGTDGGTSVVTIVKEQAGKWILSGANTYSGGTLVSTGTLVVSNASALGTGLVNMNGGTLESTVGTLSSNRFASGGGGTITASVGGSKDFNKFGTGTLNLNGTANDFTGGVTVGGGTLAVAASSALGQNVIGNSITIRDGGILTLAAAANSGANQAITLSSSSKSGAPVSTTAGGAGPTGRLAVLGLGFNGLPNGAISQANTNGGVIALNAVTGYNTDLSTLLTGKNLYLGAIGTSTFTGAAGTVAAGNGSLYRLGGGGGQITFNTTNLFTSSNGVQIGSIFLNGGGTVVISAAQDYSGATAVSQGTLTLSGADGSATGSSGFTLDGGKLFLNSFGAGNNNANRIGAVNVTLSNGGELHLSGNASGTAEAFGDLNLGAGYSTVTAQAVTANSILAGVGFSRTNNGTALFRGTSLGLQTGVAGRITLSDTSGLSFVGASTLNDAVNGDTTKNVKIIPYLVGATAFNGAGDSFVTYDSTLGFRVLNTTNQFNSTVTAGTNVRFAAAQTNIGTNSINSLIVAQAGPHTISDGATLTVTSGALLFSSGGTIAPVGAGTGILNFGSAEGIVTTVGDSTISAKITGSGGLTKSGTAKLTLSNAGNTFSGGIVVNGGTLTANLDSYLGDASNNITVNGNAIMGLGNVSYARSITLNNGSILNINNETPNFTGNITGTGGLAVGISAGFSASAIFSGINNNFEGPILIAGSGSGNANYHMTFASLADSSSANGRIVFSGNAINGTTGSRFAYTGGTGGNSSLVLNNRQIELASTVVGPTAGHQIVNSSVGTGTLTVATDLIVSTPIDQTLSLRGANTGANTFSGKIIDGDGKVSLLKTDAGRWIVSGANTFSGSTLISGGTLELGNSLALQNSLLDATNSVTGGAAAGLKTTVSTLTLGGLNGTKNLSTLFTTTSGGYGNVTALTLNPATGQTSSYSGVIADGASGMTLTKTGAGAQVLSGANTYTGATTIQAGTLLLGSNDRLSNTTPVTVAGGTLDISTFTNTVASFSMSSGALNGTGTLTAATYLLTGGTLAANLGAGAVTVNGDVTFSAAGRLNASSSLLIQGGTLTLSGNESVNSFQQTGGTVAGGFAINSATDSDLQSGTFSGNLGGSGGINKTGAGTTTITGTNSYTGATNVTSGTLVVNGNIASSSLTTVASGATIGGSGTVGVLTVSSGAFINPGNSPGILNTGDYTQVGTYSAEITGIVAGTEHDQINVTGTVDITGGSLTTLFSAGTYAENDLIFILLNDGADAITGTYAGLANGALVENFGGFNWTISYFADSTAGPSGSFTGGNDIALRANAIPEPNVAALLGCLGVLLILRRRR
jgi:autotransporter-associated beta strand protein